MHASFSERIPAPQRNTLQAVAQPSCKRRTCTLPSHSSHLRIRQHQLRLPNVLLLQQARRTVVHQVGAVLRRQGAAGNCHTREQVSVNGTCKCMQLWGATVLAGTQPGGCGSAAGREADEWPPGL